MQRLCRAMDLPALAKETDDDDVHATGWPAMTDYGHDGVDRALVTFVSTADGVAGLRAAADLLSDTLLSHLAYEERELVEPIARLGLS
jgi:hypothetical protein